MALTNQLLQSFNQTLLLFEQDLLLLNCALLLVDSVDQNGGHLLVLDAFHFTLWVVMDEERVNFFDLFGAKAQVVPAACAPVESDRAAYYYRLKLFLTVKKMQA